jgi:TRAP-type uncharacterized transport system substrate-binding protein
MIATEGHSNIATALGEISREICNMKPSKLPVWLRGIVIAGIIMLVSGASLFAWRWYSRPTTLTVVVGSIDGEANRLISALAGKFAQQKAPVRLHIREVGSIVDAASAFSSGKADLAVVRGDIGGLSGGQAVAVLAHAIVWLAAPPGLATTDMAGLKRVAIGVIGGEINKRVVSILTEHFGLARSGVTFKNVGLADARRMIDTKEVRALLAVMPLTERHLSLLRSMFPSGVKSAPTLIEIGSAAAIAEKERAYESFDIPKGTLRGSPPDPPEDVTTLRTSYYLIAQKALSNDVVADLAKSIMNARRDLLTEVPISAQIAAPDTDVSSDLVVHPGAAAFHDGTQESLLDKWGNIIFLVPMITGAIVSALAMISKFLRVEMPSNLGAPLDGLYALGRRIRSSGSGEELDEIEREIDAILQAKGESPTMGDDGVRDIIALNVAAYRLDNLIRDRRSWLASRPSDPLRERAKSSSSFP